ncbi:MAG: hypothetical protein QGF00_25205 [Planctomycetota bacterium]|jgi:Leucine-rich repeat (LRR) protein|nr:hypothetical protein [Planctomycetota bacterium]
MGPETRSLKLARVEPETVASAVGVAVAIICLVVGVAFQRVSHQRDQAEVAQKNAEISEEKAKTSEAKATEAYRQQRKDAMAASKRFSLQAVRTAETGRFVETERRIADAESVLKGSPWIFFARGKYAEARKDYAEAEDFYMKAIEKDESITEARNALAELKALQGDLTNAEELIAGIENETDWKNLLRAAKLLYRAGKWSDSAKVNERAVALMEQAADSATEKDNKSLQALLDEARYSIGDARAAEACVGFYDQVKGRLRHEQSGAVAKKLVEINQKQKGVNQFMWSYTDTTNRFLVVSIHHDDELKYIHPLSGFPIQKLTLTNHRKLRQVHALIGMPLKYLDITATPVTDLSPLNRLPLEYLNISFQPIQEITALRGMSLKHLDVSDTRVTDLSPLSEMSSIESLSIVHIWPMKDISPLRGLKLKHLYATYTSIVDISPLAGMPLETLTLFHTPVKDISVLRGMKLKRLDASHHTTDLSPIEGMPLQYLDVRDSSVFKIDIVKDMPLEIFNCSGTLRTETLAPLAGKKLKECYFERTKVSDLSPLAGMPITRLGFNFTKVSDLSPLKSMPLDRLEFVDTPVSDITPLAGAPIRNLNLSGTVVADLSPLTDSTQLYTLDMNNTLVSDLSPLKKVLTLGRLQIASTKVTDLSPLQDTNISELNIAHTPTTDLTPLEGMKRIAFLTVSAGQEFTPESKALLEKLKAKGGFKVTVVKAQ